jgi:hypothetical protein
VRWLGEFHLPPEAVINYQVRYSLKKSNLTGKNIEPAPLTLSFKKPSDYKAKNRNRSFLEPSAGGNRVIVGNS